MKSHCHGGMVVTKPLPQRVPGFYGIAMSQEKTFLHYLVHSLSYLNGFGQNEACTRNSCFLFDKKLQVNRIGEQSLSSTKKKKVIKMLT